jgi:hypothetical protein
VGERIADLRGERKEEARAAAVRSMDATREGGIFRRRFLMPSVARSGSGSPSTRSRCWGLEGKEGTGESAGGGGLLSVCLACWRPRDESGHGKPQKAQWSGPSRRVEA